MRLSRFGRQVNAWVLAGSVLGLIWLRPPVSREMAPGREFQEGNIEGQVILSPRIAARRPRFRLYTEYGQASQPPKAAVENEMTNVVIYLDSAAGGGGPVPGEGPTEIRQEGEAFSPHVLPVVIGTAVEFPNKDPFFHNVFSLSKPKTFDLGRYPQGASKTVRFDRTGVVQVFCHIHSDMSAAVVVVANRFFATPDPRGTFAIRGIPPGTYRLTAWHERAKPITTSVRIEAGKTARVDFNIPIADVESVKH